MERKRKVPARAAARASEHPAKKGRTTTPPDHQNLRSATPSSALNSTPAPDENEQPQKPAAPPLPTSLQPGKPLPTVEDAQPEDLPSKEYQSLQERYEPTQPNSSSSAFPKRPYSWATLADHNNRCLLQWCPGRVTRPITSKMDQRRSFREILDETDKEEGRCTGRRQKPPQRQHGQGRPGHHLPRTALLRSHPVRSQRSQQVCTTAALETHHTIRPAQRYHASASYALDQTAPHFHRICARPGAQCCCCCCSSCLYHTFAGCSPA